MARFAEYEFDVRAGYARAHHRFLRPAEKGRQESHSDLALVVDGCRLKAHSY
jgi:hypothetical protein